MMPGKSTATKKQVIHQITADVHSSYDSEFRFLSYWKQIEWVLKLKPARILYVGVGTGFVTDYLRKHGFEIDTVDIDAALKPTYAVPILQLEKISKTYDLVMACEVLEHIPLEDVPAAMEQLSRVAKKCIISVPENRSKIWFAFKIPLVPETKIIIPLPFYSNHVTHEHHFWELNPHTQKTLENAFYEKGWCVILRERVAKLTTHMFYLLER